MLVLWLLSYWLNQPIPHLLWYLNPECQSLCQSFVSCDVNPSPLLSVLTFDLEANLMATCTSSWGWTRVIKPVTFWGQKGWFQFRKMCLGLSEGRGYSVVIVHWGIRGLFGGVLPLKTSVGNKPIPAGPQTGSQGVPTFWLALCDPLMFPWQPPLLQNGVLLFDLIVQLYGGIVMSHQPTHPWSSECFIVCYLADRSTCLNTNTTYYPPPFHTCRVKRGVA